MMSTEKAEDRIQNSGGRIQEYRRPGVQEASARQPAANGEPRTVNGERAKSMIGRRRLEPQTSNLERRTPCFSQARRYGGLVKNITVSLPDEVYRKARVKAAERNTSLSAMVKQFLESLAEDEGEFKKLERLQEESYAEIERFQASHRLTREELYRRGNVR